MEKMDWDRLDKLRALFLEDGQGARGKDYWASHEILELYDQTFAQRIGWKWQAVMEEFVLKGGVLPDAPKILDWGCGTGIASRTFLNCFPEVQAEVYVYDRSAKASQFALNALAREFPQTTPRNWLPAKPRPNIILLSHVINELDAKTLQELKTLILAADLCLWVEPGTHKDSRKLIEVREFFREHLTILAPCPQQGACPMLAKENATHWCHNFADPPSEVFQSAFWQQFSRTLKIDLRSLATSFLILTRKQEPQAVANDNRVLGRARRLKAHLEIIVCTHSGHIQPTQIPKRSRPQDFKRLAESAFHQTVEISEST